MFESLARKTLVAAFLIAAPPVLVMQALRDAPAAPWVAMAAAAPGTFLALGFALSLSRQVQRLRVYVSQMLDPALRPAHLSGSGDEMGDLVRALNDIAPKIDELVNRLSVELKRREAILASMTEGVLAVDAKLNITFCNHSFVRSIGDHGAIEGMPLVRVVREPDFLELLKRVLETGNADRKRLRLSMLDSPSFEVYAAPLASSRSRGAIAILHDVTPGERLDRMRRDFVANVSHEFRTPLATIRGYAETLLEGALEDRENRRKFVETILANAVRLNNIAADLLALSELEAGRPEGDAGPISVAEVIRSASRAIEPAASLSGVHIKTEPIPETFVFGHRLRLEQAILNLLDNAVKFNKPDGEVRIQVNSDSTGGVEIAISDTGLGIPREDLDRIFERFYRVDKARSRQVGGTGLGLSIVKHAVEQMHGAVRVESELGKGSRFIITVPAQSAS
jgi:two-component system phosphate regulon sensor histidine kinase PhoR